MARFGLLYLNEGSWGEEQILDADWIVESTTAYTEKGLSGDGYGYMWSIISGDSGFGGGFHHTGLGVHLLAVLPEQQIVLSLERKLSDRSRAAFVLSWHHSGFSLDGSNGLYAGDQKAMERPA